MREVALNVLVGEIAACNACALASGRTATVPGEGPASAKLMLVGEAPGAREDREGRPFVGASGTLLNQLLAGAGLSRNDVFITNTVKCRPPDNRDPRADEIASCSTFLSRQIEAISPQVVATLGRHALAVFAPGAIIGEAHGAPFRGERQNLDSGVILFPLYHPAAALHNGKLRPTLEEDMRALAALLGAPARAEAGTATLYGTPQAGVRAEVGRGG